MYIQYVILADSVLLISVKSRQGCRDRVPPGISSVPSGLSDSSLETPPGTGWRGVKGCRVLGTTREGERARRPHPPIHPPASLPRGLDASSHRLAPPLPPCSPYLPASSFSLGTEAERRRRLNDFLSPSQNVDVYLDGRREPDVSDPSPTCCLTRIRRSFGGAHAA